MNCASCGANINAQEKYCSKCGSPVATVTGVNEIVNSTEIQSPVTNKGYFTLYLETLKKYSVFSGRSSRKEYWTFVIINFLIAFIIGFIEGLFNSAADTSESVTSTLFNLIVLIPTWAVSIRRMHDVSKSGWCILIPIYNFILTLRQGDAASNIYGEKPII